MIGDVREQLRALPAESVHCIVTSPPYWGLRDYGVDGQIGLEATPAEFIAVMVDVFNEARRVLRADGTCWINMGDSYATGAGAVGRAPGGGDQGERFIRRGMVNTQPNRKKLEGFKPKDLCMMPHRLAIALQDAGWWVRQDIVWSKPNPMPESVRDRCTKSHEYIFLLTKSANYYYDAEAIKEPAAGAADHPRNSFGTKDYEVPGQKPQKRTARGVGFGHGTDADARQRGRVMACSKDDGRDEQGLRTAARMGGGAGFREDPAARPDMRNKRSVWTMATHSFAEAHFATFPPELPEICIRAGCPPSGTVLDPFFGAGTTGLVADRLQRDCIGIELNPAYAEIARKRIQGESSLLADVHLVVGTPVPRVGEAHLSLIPEVAPRQIAILEMEAV
ncbi:site-specific DNA-methyltransferase [Janthinobacterium sp. AD80]|uniref:DNA-methyltransferase n=1 Tax=Janthinobacterium sp. AD80 TaxID=1528773 RepID=UPI0021557E36|nr:site-specific DNA-methyltransferase [Janthinobacterium sp. AD80]